MDISGSKLSELVMKETTRLLKICFATGVSVEKEKVTYQEIVLALLELKDILRKYFQLSQFAYDLGFLQKEMSINLISVTIIDFAAVVAGKGKPASQLSEEDLVKVFETAGGILLAAIVEFFYLLDGKAKPFGEILQDTSPGLFALQPDGSTVILIPPSQGKPVSVQKENTAQGQPRKPAKLAVDDRQKIIVERLLTQTGMPEAAPAAFLNFLREQGGEIDRLDEAGLTRWLNMFITIYAAEKGQDGERVCH